MLHCQKQNLVSSKELDCHEIGNIQRLTRQDLLINCRGWLDCDIPLQDNEESGRDL